MVLYKEVENTLSIVNNILVTRSTITCSVTKRQQHNYSKLDFLRMFNEAYP